MRCLCGASPLAAAKPKSPPALPHAPLPPLRPAPQEIRCDGTGIPELLKGIMTLLPLDETAPPAVLMGMMPEHKAAGWQTPIWDVYKAVVAEGNGGAVPFEEVERFAFYERAKKAYAVVATGETALYGNLILKKGVIGSAK